MGTRVNETAQAGHYITGPKKKDSNTEKVDITSLKQKMQLNHLMFKLLKGKTDIDSTDLKKLEAIELKLEMEKAYIKEQLRQKEIQEQLKEAENIKTKGFII